MKNYQSITFSSLLIILMFIFHSCDELPKVETKPVVESDITTTTAIVRGEVTDSGGDAVFERGICYGTAVNPTEKEEASEGGIGNFEVTLTGLTPDTDYFVRAYAINGEGPEYGDDEEFRTEENTLPEVVTESVTDISTTTATSGGNITSDGGVAVTARGVCWSTAANPTTADSKTSDGTGAGSFTSSITGLTPDTEYFVRAYAVNGAVTSYGDNEYFRTKIEIIPPEVQTESVEEITYESAVVQGNVVSDGGAEVTARGICYGTSPEPTEKMPDDEAGEGIFEVTLTDLESETDYYARAYATNSAGTAYGVDQPFTTSNRPAEPATVTTSSISNITETTAQGGGNVTSDGGEAVTAKGVCWSTTTNPTTADSKTNDGTGTGSFTSSLTGLSPGTTYHVRAYATNSVGTAYGDQENFTTEEGPTLTTTSVSDITENSASSGGIVTSDGGAAVTVRGVCWSTSQDPTISDNFTTDGSGTGSFTSSISSLAANTTYYVRAYATNSVGTAYGNNIPFTTLCATPSATTNAATNVGTTTATLNGTVNANGNSTTVTFEYGKTTSYGSTITATQSPVTGSSNTSVSAKLTGLEPNTTYHYRAKAVSCGGTSNGDDQTFQTLCLAPLATIGGYASGYENTQIGGTVNAYNSSTTVIFEYGTTTSFGSTITATQSPVTGISDTYVSALLTELDPDTRYYYRIRAINCGGTVYSNDFDFTTPLCPESLTITHTPGSGVAPVTKTITYGVAESDLTGENKCWITQNLGASNQASSATDGTEAAAGWYWQFNRRQGYQHDGTTRTPNTTWIASIDENSNWTAANDPCTILLGSGWRIPTSTEWTNADNNGGWSNYNDTYASELKLHAAGHLFWSTGDLNFRDYYGHYWSSVQNDNAIGRFLTVTSSSARLGLNGKTFGYSVRCLKD